MVSSAWRWFVAAGGLAVMVLAYEEWHSSRRPNAVLFGALAGALFVWAGAGLGFSILWIIGLAWIAIAAAVALRHRYPHPVVSRLEGQPGLVVRMVPAELGGKRRLRDETMALVREMHDYINAGPGLEAEAEAHTRFVRASAGKSEAETNALWDEYTNELTRRTFQEQRDNQQQFGGRTEYLLASYVRRGLINTEETRSLLWSLNSRHWMMELARRLEALARSL